MTSALRSPVLAVANDDRVGLFDLQRQRARLESDIKARIDAVLAHGQFILGPEVELFEKRLAEYVGVPYVVAVSSGRDALMIALMALDVRPGDAVFVPSFTFAATAGAVASIGASPVFVDVDPVTYNMDPADLRRAIAEVRAAGALAPKVVMPVDLYGLPADYDAIAEIADEHGMTVLADAAQSMGGRAGKRVGALAPITATSFYPTKPLGCYGDGGAVLTEREDLAERVRMIRSHGRQGTGDAAMVLGLTGRLDTIQAAVLLVKLDVFDRELDRRRAIAARYTAGLKDIVTVPASLQGLDSACAIYTICVKQRDRVRALLDEDGIGTGLFYRLALHEHPAFRHFDGRPMPVSERLTAEVISLPMHPDLSDEEVDRVIAAVGRAVAQA